MQRTVVAKPEFKSPSTQISALGNLKLRANLDDFANYHSGKHSIDPESRNATPETLTQPQKAQIKESLNYYHATKNKLGQSLKK